MCVCFLFVYLFFECVMCRPDVLIIFLPHCPPPASSESPLSPTKLCPFFFFFYFSSSLPIESSYCYPYACGVAIHLALVNLPGAVPLKKTDFVS